METKTIGIDTAFLLTSLAHHGQVDKSGRAYILHCVRVLDLLKDQDEATQVLGLMHDTIEDKLTMEQIDSFTNDYDFIGDLELLTRIKDESYFDYIDRVSTSKRATIVKLADLQDHLNNAQYIGDSLLTRYQKAFDILTKANRQYHYEHSSQDQSRQSD